ncbi:MAG TPA: CvpA family protein [Firmicutes bacterium]|nr:CvpA family protein [Bacillota bacterium]
MSWLDLLIIGFFLALGYRGFSEGFVLQFGKIGGPILGLLLAFMTYERWGATLSLYLNVPQALTGAGAFLLVSVGVTVGVGLLARWMQSSVQQARFGLCDRLFGALFGLLCAFILAGSFMAVIFGSNLHTLAKLGEVVETSGVAYQIFTLLPRMFGVVNRLLG